MNIRLDNKVAVVTGGSSGIGLACAELLAASGATVALVARQPERLAEAVGKVRQKGMATGYQLDVTNIPAIGSIVRRIRRDLGEVDILVCSAGINIYGPAIKVTEAQWDVIFSMNAKGLFFCSQQIAIQSMIPRKTGSIINIASQMGLVGGLERVAYCGSKGAVVQLTKAEAVEWASYNVRVNGVAPTFVLTPLSEGILSSLEFKKYVLDNIPLNRLAEVGDIAASLCFLASDKADMVTGTIFTVDGGWTAR